MATAFGRLFRGGWILAAAGAAAVAQQYSISTLAGAAPPATAASATAFSIGQPSRVTVDGSGNFYFSGLNCVFKVSASGAVTLVAGNSHAGFSGDGGPAVNAQLNTPRGLALDSAGNLYIADSGNNRVRKVTAAGVISTFAGNGQPPAAYNSDGDYGPPTSANLHLPSGVAVDAAGNVYIADTSNHSIRKVAIGSGFIATIAGDTTAGSKGDTFQANLSELNAPEDVALDSSGNIYIADTGNGLIRKITTDGVINTFAGSTTIGFAGDGGLATSADLIEPFSVTVDTTGNVYIAETYDSRIREVTLDGKINTIAGTGTGGYGGDGGKASAAQFNSPTGVAADSGGNLYIADSLNLRIRKISGGTAATAAGDGVFSYAGDGGPALQALMNRPQGVAVDASGNTYFSDSGNNVVRKIDRNGVISNFAGIGSAGYGGDGGKASSAQLNAPEGLVVDKLGNLLIADSLNHRVRKVASDGTIATLAGSGTPGYAGDGGSAASAQVNLPYGVAADANGNLYIAEFGNNVIRKVSSSGTIATVAGNGVSGYSGDGGPAVKAQLSGPQAVAVDAAGNLYIGDTNNNRVRLVTGGAISTFAGNGAGGSAGDLGPATAAQLANPVGLAVDAAGSVYVSDGSARIRRIAGGVITTVAGNGSRGFSGDGGPAPQAALSGPQGLAFDAQGDLYVADSGNNAIRMLQPLSATLSIAAVTNGASNLPGPISPGEVVVLYGSGLGPNVLAPSQLDTNGLVSNNLGGARVWFNGAPAPIVYAWNTQVAAVVPYSVSGSTVQVAAQYQNLISAPATVAVAPSSPGLFTLNASGKGQAVALNQDGTNALNGAANPIQRGSSIALYVTGVGQTNPAGADGQLGSAPLPVPAQPVTATIGGLPATVSYQGEIQGVVNGVMLAIVQVPSGIAPGNATPVSVQVNGVSSQAGVTIAVKQ
ncbi:MAG: hypothetical protein ABSC23_10565 [Bryobacteraceae bacterium]